MSVPPGPPVMPVDVTTRFDRFPFAMKGAFVVRGADGNPHAVRLVEGAVARLPGGARHSFPVEDRIIDVAPNRDLFVPFEAPVSELAPGWYQIRSAVEVDGSRTWRFGSRPFTIPWPRTEVRRGTVRVDREVDVAGGAVVVVRVEMGADTSTVVWRRDTEPEGRPGRAFHAVLLVEDRPLEVLPAEVHGRTVAPAPGEQRTVAYPVPKSARSLAVAFQAGSERVSTPVALSLG